MSLTQAYIDYLKNQGQGGSGNLFITALETNGYEAEACFLQNYYENLCRPLESRFEKGLYAGRKVYVGPFLPDKAQTGEIWFDTWEINSMIRLPPDRPDPEETYSPEALARFLPDGDWLSLRPVAVWQYAAFLNCVKTRPAEIPIPPPIPLLDRKRLPENETGSMTGIMCYEASMYAVWFGKSIAITFKWLHARELFSGLDWKTLWAGGTWEWEGFLQEGLACTHSPDTLDLDLMDQWDRIAEGGEKKPIDRKLFYGEWDTPEDVYFRTSVTTELGMRDSSKEIPKPFSTQMVNLYPAEYFRRT